MILLVSPASSSSLDEYIAVGFAALLDLAFEALVVVAAVALLEGVVLIVAIGEDFAAGEKLIFVCRLRSRAFLAIINAVAVKDTRYNNVKQFIDVSDLVHSVVHHVAFAPRRMHALRGACSRFDDNEWIRKVFLHVLYNLRYRYLTQKAVVSKMLVSGRVAGPSDGEKMARVQQHAKARDVMFVVQCKSHGFSDCSL
jgi:hypothetical protein